MAVRSQCPSLSSSSPLDKRIKTSMIADFFTLIGLPAYDYKVVEKEMEEIKAQRLLGLNALKSASSRKSLMPLRRDSNSSLGTDDGSVNGSVSSSPKKKVDNFGPFELHLIADFVDEVRRSGSFRRIYPTAKTESYTPYFGTLRYSNAVLAHWLKSGGEKLLQEGFDGDLSRMLKVSASPTRRPEFV